MSESEYQIVRDQRKEILIPMFEFINGSECFYMVGGPSLGQTRLLDFLMREDVQKNYLKDEGHDTWLVRVDMNRLAVQNEAWAVYELLLNSLIVELNGHENVASHREDFLRMDFKVLKKKELPLALRNFELAVNILCQGNNIKLCFLLDEFDRIYRHLSPETFSQLRAIRDSNKYSVIYGIFLRELPERLRPSPDPDNEDFYELISRNKLGLGPYSKIDTVEIIKKLEKRRGFDMMTSFQRDRLYEASGGHIGLVQVILSIIQEDPQLPQRLGSQGWLDWLSQHPMSVDESRKIWKGLSKDEQDGLSAFLKGNYHAIPEPVSTLLLAKGLIRKTSNGPCLFSPIFDHYARSLG